MIRVSIGELENLALGDDAVSRDGTPLKPVGIGDWVSDGKYETCEVVFAADDGRFYRGEVSRSGSYYTDYTYESEFDDGDANIKEVRKVTKTVEVWEAVE